MRGKKNRGLRFLPLAKYMKARQEARSFRKLYRDEFVERALANARAKLAQQDAALATSLYEWLTTYVLICDNGGDLSKRREEYRAYHKSQFDKYQAKRKQLSEVRLHIEGKTRTYSVF